VIRKIRHRGLRKLYDHDDASGVNAQHVDKLREILLVLDAARAPNDVDLPGYRLHRLKPAKEGRWSIRVSGNWRVTFRFEGNDVTDVKYEDYH
jgi:proteic killer suppression protein